MQNRLGVIISYDIHYAASDMNGATLQENIMTTEAVLNDLLEYTNYTIFVRARTAVGPGPFTSPLIMILTNESSKNSHFLALENKYDYPPILSIF